MSPANVVVSVIVPTLNRPVALSPAVASIAGQQSIDLAEIEVIIVNDGGQPIDHVIAATREWGPVI